LQVRRYLPPVGEYDEDGLRLLIRCSGSGSNFGKLRSYASLADTEVACHVTVTVLITFLRS